MISDHATDEKSDLEQGVECRQKQDPVTDRAAENRQARDRDGRRDLGQFRGLLLWTHSGVRGG